MKQFSARFGKDESGAVSTEFVVITAAVVALGIAGMATIGDGAIDSAAIIGSDLETDVDISYSSRAD